jgi:hypothetical protein
MKAGEEGYAWAELWDADQLRDFFKTRPKVLSKIPEKFKALRVEIHHSYDSGLNQFAYVWGDKQPTIMPEELGTHEGIYMEIDHVVVYNGLKPAGEDHDPECEICTGTKS